MDEVLEFLDKIQPVLLIAVPSIWVYWTKIKNSINEKTKQIKASDTKKNKELYNTYQHEQSKDTIRRVQDMCNLYKDKTKADQVMYIQLENGTVATSKLCNMFISCLAEDNRYSSITKKLARLQRVPFSSVTGWIPENASKVVSHSDLSDAIELTQHIVFEGVASSLSVGVFDEEGILIGMVVLNYKDKKFDGADEEEQRDYLKSYSASIESIFMMYNSNCSQMKKELNLEEV